MEALGVCRIGRFFRKPFRWAALYALVLTAAAAFVLMDTFVIPRTLEPVLVQVRALPVSVAAGAPVSAAPSVPPEAAPAKPEAEVSPGLPAASDPGAAREPLETAAAADPPEQSLETPLDAGSAAGEEPPTNAGPLITDRSYTDENIRITIDTYRRQDTTIYLADIVVSGVEYLKTALAKDRYGRNIRDTTSAMAAEHGAILAINGDYYGFRDAGCVLRNGTLYRDAGNGEALVMDWQGDLRCVSEASLTQADIESAWQIWSFGPVLIKDGQIAVGAGTEIQGRSAPSNPRTAIGQAGPLHYVMIVSDGRTRTDRGLSLLELAEEFALRGCTIAYNLDGGGSSSMVFNGQVLNRPTTNGRTIDEREVSDIVYAGYR